MLNWFRTIVVLVCTWCSCVHALTQQNEDMGSFLKKQLKTVKNAPMQFVNPSLTRQLIYAHSDKLKPVKQVYDEFFKVAPEGAIRLRRNTEFCQYKEIQMLNRDGTPAGYDYRAHWSTTLIDSSSFHDDGHENPDIETFDTHYFSTSDLHMGPYKLGSLMLSKLQDWKPVELTREHLEDVWYADTLAFKRGFVNFGGPYFYKHPESEVSDERKRLFKRYLEGDLAESDFPKLSSGKKCVVGEIRISVDAVTPTEISVIGKQINVEIELGDLTCEIRISFDAVTPTELSVIGRQNSVSGDLGDPSSLKLVGEGNLSPEELMHREMSKASRLQAEAASRSNSRKPKSPKGTKKKSRKDKKGKKRNNRARGDGEPDLVFGDESIFGEPEPLGAGEPEVEFVDEVKSRDRAKVRLRTDL